MDFPYKKYFILDVKERFDNLKKIDLEKLYDNKYHNKHLIFKTKELFIKTFFILIGEDYYSDVLSDVFNEEERIKTSKSGKQSLLDIFERDSTLRRDIFSMKTIEEKREYIYQKYGYFEATQFKPSIVISILKHFKPNKVLDMSSGWGDRLIGSLAYSESSYFKEYKDKKNNIRKEEDNEYNEISYFEDNFVYDGFDPNKNLQKGYSKIIESFSTNKNNRYTIRDMCFEDLKIDNNSSEINTIKSNYYDLFFSSPPFFDLEIYSKDSDQSTTKYKDFNSWLVNFLFKSLFIAYQALKDGKDMLIHISDYIKDKNNIQICEKMCLFLTSIGMEYKGIIYTCKNKKLISTDLRPMWYFVKNKNKEKIMFYINLFKITYPDIYSLCENKYFF
jgi:hypothetical protein